MKYFLFLFLFTNICSSQKSIKVSYESKKIISNEAAAQIPADLRENLIAFLTKPVVLELVNNGNSSIVKNIPNKDINIPSNTLKTSTQEDRGTIIKPFVTWILKDFNIKTNFRKSAIKETEYYITSDFDKKKKIIFDDKTLKIDGYNCRSALEINEINDTIQHWFTQEIPVIDGPKEFLNIPGLILRSESKNEQIYAIKIEFFDIKIIIEELTKNIKVVSSEDFKILRDESKKATNYTDDKGVKHSTETQNIKL